MLYMQHRHVSNMSSTCAIAEGYSGASPVLVSARVSSRATLIGGEARARVRILGVFPKNAHLVFMLSLRGEIMQSPYYEERYPQYYDELARGAAFQLVIQWPIYDLRPFFSPHNIAWPHNNIPDVRYYNERTTWYAHCIGKKELKHDEYIKYHLSKFIRSFDTAGSMRFCNGDNHKTPFSPSFSTKQVAELKVIERNYLPYNQCVHLFEFVIHCVLKKQCEKTIQLNTIESILTQLTNIRIKGWPIHGLTDEAACNSTHNFFEAAKLCAARYRYVTDCPMDNASLDYVSTSRPFITLRAANMSKIQFPLRLTRYKGYYIANVNFRDRPSIFLFQTRNIRLLRDYAYIPYREFYLHALVGQKDAVESFLNSILYDLPADVQRTCRVKYTNLIEDIKQRLCTLHGNDVYNILKHMQDPNIEDDCKRATDILARMLKFNPNTVKKIQRLPVSRIKTSFLWNLRSYIDGNGNKSI